MNRDEAKTRAQATPPQTFLRNGIRRLQPIDPAGGTWISVNENGLTALLLNWYPEARIRAGESRISRGLIVDGVVSSENLRAAREQLTQWPLNAFPAFRLLLFEPTRCEIHEHRWDQERLDTTSHSWVPGFWASSGYDEPQAQRVRFNTYQQRLQSPPPPDSKDRIRHLLASHEPEKGPFSICMHRNDAQTVSGTEIIYKRGRFVMAYHDGPPCLGQPWRTFSLATAHDDATRHGS